MKRKHSMVMELHSTAEMTGINQAWRLQRKNQVTFFVSPAVYTLLEDESVAAQVLNDICCKEINHAITAVLKLNSKVRLLLEL